MKKVLAMVIGAVVGLAMVGSAQAKAEAASHGSSALMAALPVCAKTVSRNNEVMAALPAYAKNEVTIDEGDVAMTVSPMRESMVLNPGDEYRGMIKITNPSVAVQDLYYRIDVKPFYVDIEYQPMFEEVGDSSQIVDWITIDSPAKGAVHPNESAEVEYTIKVPADAPAGGQYAGITVSTDFESAAKEGINIGEALSITHLVLAEITGEVRVDGEIMEMGVDGFVTNGGIGAYAVIRNTGNVHALATYTMEVSSLLLPDILYSNEKAPETHYILPDRTLYNETFWADTPMVGIFNVNYMVEYQGEMRQLSRVVVVCPVWLLVILILLALILTAKIVKLVRRAAKKSDKKSEKVVDSEKPIC